jgi:hypothetical protein
MYSSLYIINNKIRQGDDECTLSAIGRWWTHCWEVWRDAGHPATDIRRGECQAIALIEASHVYIRRGGAIPPLAPLYTPSPYKVPADRPNFQAGDWWWPPGDYERGSLIGGWLL